MKLGKSQNSIAKRARPPAVGRKTAPSAHRGDGHRVETMGESAKLPEAMSRRMEAVRAHPLAELLQCPPDTGELLNSSAQFLHFAAGEVVFRQSEECMGLYLVASGHFFRRAERMETRLLLGPARAGDLVELAATLGDCRHTYTFAAQSEGSLLFLPIEALNRAFLSFPPLRMRLLEELAREVSRAYNLCCMSRAVKPRRKTSAA